MTERRFNEEEVAAIFERATNAQRTDPVLSEAGEGLTLSELQQIGHEVGLAPELIRQAAQTLGQSTQVMQRTFMGLPIGVGRIVDLPRRISEDEWERLVVDLRETFDARGVVRGDGSLRQWTNGNLQALLEPTASGHRLRLRTIKSDARSSIIGGLALLSGALFVILMALVRGGVSNVSLAISSVGMLGSFGAVMIAAGAWRVPRWARLRQKQMEEVSARLARATAIDPKTISAP